MEDKIFNLLEKVYIELQGTKKHVERVEQEVSGLKQEQAVTNSSLSKLEVKIEHDISHKIDALYEFRDVAINRFDRIEKKVDEISEKVDKHDIKIQVIEGGKKKKA